MGEENGNENGNGNHDRDAYSRFGGNAGWDFKDRYLLVGEAITGEGPGKGVIMLPWALDHYEGALGLKPGESWLLRRMLAHAWKFKGLVFLSIRKISIESGVTRATIHSYIKNLVKKELIERVERDEPNPKDRRVCYDVSKTYLRLALAIACDPSSNWAQLHGGPLSEVEFKQLNWTPSNLGKIRRLAKRRRSRQTADE